MRFARELLPGSGPGAGHIDRGALRPTIAAGRVAGSPALLGPIPAPAHRGRGDRVRTGLPCRIEAARRLVRTEAATGLGSGPVRCAPALVSGAVSGIGRTSSAGVSRSPAVTPRAIEWAGLAPAPGGVRCPAVTPGGVEWVRGVRGPRTLRVASLARLPLRCTGIGTRPAPACAGTGAGYRGRPRPVRFGGIPAAVSSWGGALPRGTGPAVSAGLGGPMPAGPLRGTPRPAQRAEDPGETAHAPRRGRFARCRCGRARHRPALTTRGIGVVERKRTGRRRGGAGVAGVGFPIAVWHVRRGVAVETWMPLGWRRLAGGPLTAIGTGGLAGSGHSSILAHGDRGETPPCSGRAESEQYRFHAGRYQAGTNRTSKTVGQYFPVIRKRSVPGICAIPLRTSAPARWSAGSSPAVSITDRTRPASGSIRRI